MPSPNLPSTLLTFAAGAALLLSAGSCQRETDPPARFGSVRGLATGEEGTPYLATDRGLFFFHPDRAAYEQVPSGPDEIPLNDLFLSGGSLWLASDLGAWNHKSGETLRASDSGLADDRVLQVLESGAGPEVFAGPDSLSIRCGQKWLYSEGWNGLYRDFPVSDMGATGDGYIYVATLGGGVERFSPGVDGITGATLFDTDWSGLRSNHVHSVWTDGILQAYGTDAGAAIHTSGATKWDWVTYTVRDGLASDTVLSVLRDANHHWWFGTPRGVSRFDGESWTTYTSASHGLLSDTALFLATDPEGRIWTASHSGLSRFDGSAWTAFPQ